ncbi:hypothetical protein [Bacillus sp. NSP9.1]|uniref:hypothetical protein n=1 Tax=Bacillus sp. NSP9.1 TaxID=1071078 RepID=UPI0013D4CCB5
MNISKKRTLKCVLFDGITFFIEESDVWYFDGHDLLVTYNESSEEPVFESVKKKNA